MKETNEMKEMLEITIPPEFVIDELSDKVAKLRHVNMHTALKGTATPPDGAGMKFEFELPQNSRVLKVTVLNRPKEVSLDYIKGRLDSDIKHGFAGYEID